MLAITSTSSPSTSAARLAYSRCNGVPPRASQKIIAASAPATTTSASAISGLTVAISRIATQTARLGGMTFQVVVLSVW